MVKNGLSQSIILLKIKNTASNFDVSTNALIFLKENKISDEVVLAMIEKSSNEVVNNKQKNVQSNNNGNQISSQESSGSDVKQSNLDALKIIENLNGSGIYYLKISETTQPIFYFYFDTTSTSLNNSNNKAGQQPSNYLEALYGYSFQQNSKAFTPNDFKLIRLEIRRNSRMFKGGRNSFGFGMGKIPSGYFVTFKYERLSNNLFRVYFVKHIEALAQFCFLYAGNTGNKGIANPYSSSEIKVFDFGTSVKIKK